MKVFNRVKRFCSDHSVELSYAAGAFLGAVCVASGYILGYKMAMVHQTRGLELCFVAKPELKPMLDEAIQVVMKNR